MRILELEIENVRGIRQLRLQPEGKNFVIWGPNGSGKSAVVDAIDFLLTGRISRLTGKGTGGITLSKHGPHIDHNPEDAVVRAVVQLPGGSKLIEIKRSMQHPSTLECEESVRHQLQPMLAVAMRGQHILTRREILAFITAEAGTRADRIQVLLNIDEVEDLRKALVRIENDLETACDTVKGQVDRLIGAVCSTTQLKDCIKDSVLEVVNRNRAILGGEPISTLNWRDLKGGLVAPILAPDQRAEAAGKRVDVNLVDRAVENLGKATDGQNRQKIARQDKALRDFLKTFQSNPELGRTLRRVKLIQQGLDLIEEDGYCPLCDTAWAPNKLREYLENKLSTAEAANAQLRSVVDLSNAIVKDAYIIIADLERVIPVVELMGMETELQQLRNWHKDLRDLSVALEDALDR